VILFNKNAELFQFVLSQAMKQYRSMMVQNYVAFDHKWKKQLLLMLVLAASNASVGKYR
jgi:hypothetical protein